MSLIQAKILRGAAALILLRVVDRTLGLLSTVILARLLAPADFGVVAMGLAVAALVGAILDISFTQALIQRKAVAVEDYHTAFSLNLILSLLASVVLVGSIPFAQKYFGDPRVQWVLGGLAAMAFVTGFRNFGMALYERELNFTPIIVLSLVRRVASFIVTLTAAVLLESYWALVLGMLTSSIAEILMGHFLSRLRPRWSLERARELFSFSGWLLINSLLAVVSARGQDFLVGGRLGASALGQLSVAQEIASLPTFELIGPVMRAVYPGYVHLRDRRDGLATGLITVVAIALTLVVPATAGVVLVAESVVNVALGPKWTDAVPLLQLLALSSMFQSLIVMTNPVYMAIGRPKRIAAISLLYVVIAIGLLWALLASYPLAQALWALVVASSVSCLVSTLWISGPLGISRLALAKMAVRPVLATAIMSISVMGVQKTLADRFSSSDVSFLLISISVGAVAYLAAAAALWWLRIGPPAGDAILIVFLKGWRKHDSDTKSSH